MRLAALLLSFTCFISFAWALRGLFGRQQESNTAMTALSVLGSVFFIAQILAIFSQETSRSSSQLVAITLYVCSLFLFWWAVPYARNARLSVAFTSCDPAVLITSGPYRWIRHPFYTSYTLYWISGVLASGNWWLLWSVAVMGAFYFQAASREEAEYDHGPLADAYSTYRINTSKFIPGIW